MKILGIDTTTRFLCLGIYTTPLENPTLRADDEGGFSIPPLGTPGYSPGGLHNDNKIYEYRLDSGRKLSALLAVTIKRVLDALGWRARDIDYFACGVGPGSFTGLRVGMATIKGLAFSLNKPIVGISTLDILAKGAPDKGGYVLPIVDARRGLVYCSVYKNKKGKLFRIKPYMLLSIDELFKKLNINDETMVLGDALALYKEKILTGIRNATLLDKDYWYPNGHNIIDLALEEIKGKRFESASGIKPVYLYPKECQVKKKP